jgi:hypothetical protein
VQASSTQRTQVMFYSSTNSPMPHAPCSMLHAPCSMLHAQNRNIIYLVAQ